jgi:SAM-dependent methyltransferase
MEKTSSNKQDKMSGTKRRSFWEKVGQEFPSFFDAPSTRYYFGCERLLFLNYLPHLKGKKVLKTDLWDEAKNSRILNWVAGQGAEVFGLDISWEIVKEANKSFAAGETVMKSIVSDVCWIGFKDESFDGIYSMGTVEHFPDYRQALRQCHRVLKKGGTAVIGVPNKFDPFLRPLMVAFLNGLGLYAYGMEKSFSMKELERILRDSGFRIIGRSGILFIPGWLRMLDIVWHLKWPGTNFLLAPLIRCFSFFYMKFAFPRRHGYLIACIVQK